MKILFPGSFLLFFTACFTLEGTIKIFYNKTGVRGKGLPWKKRKAVKQLKKMRKAGVRAWKKKKKKGKMLAFFLFLTPFLFSTSATGQENWQGLSVPWPGKEKILEYLIQKEVVREQYVLEKSGKKQDDDTANPVLKEGAAVYLKEGKVLFFKIREEKKQTD